MTIVDQLDEARTRLNVLQHPFYVRWTRGELAPGELRGYASQYRYLVVALAEVSRQAALSSPAGDERILEIHAREEIEHISMWDRFGDALDSEPSAPFAATEKCVRAWVGGRSLDEQLAIMYVVEASQPEISRTKLIGLAEHYAMPEDVAGCEYFREHAVRDIAHANQARHLIDRRVDADDTQTAEAMLDAATAALEGNWAMLSGVEEACAVAG